MSLRSRLALWYGGVTGVVVLLVTLLTYALHTRAHYDDLDHMLAGAAAHVAAEYLSATTPEDRLGYVQTPPSPAVVLRVYEGLHLLFASPEAVLAPAADPWEVMEGSREIPVDPLVDAAPSFAPIEYEVGAFGLAVGTDGQRWRLYAMPLAGDEVLLAATPLDRVDASAERFRQLVPLLTALGATAGLLAGCLVAGSALRPVAVMTATADRIARSRDFEHRVPEASAQDELGELASTFNAMLASLEESYRSQKQFVADASHELRAPLTAIQGNLELVRRHPTMAAAEREEAINEASREASRLSMLVADLLSLARADSGMPLRHERLELDRVLLEAVAQSHHLARGQSLEVAAPHPVQVVGDRDRLKQLILIVLDNALKYTPPGGKVSVSLQVTGNKALLEVQDTGIGINREDLPRVFERFFRADPARQRDKGGTGLGLPIARWIVDQHGGAIKLASSPGRGTRAVITMPVSLT
jgi:two-component system, OmpR family, sensor kinase